MRKPSAAMILSLLLALSWIGFLAGQPRAAEPKKPAVWEYDTILDTTLSNKPQKLRDAGKQGWEAYAVTVDASSSKFYYLKRQAQ